MQRRQYHRHVVRGAGGQRTCRHAERGHNAAQLQAAGAKTDGSGLGRRGWARSCHHMEIDALLRSCEMLRTNRDALAMRAAEQPQQHSALLAPPA